MGGYFWEFSLCKKEQILTCTEYMFLVLQYQKTKDH